jgi:hypothetical protein
LYFVSNQRNKPVKVVGSFRVDGKIPEFWDADTGLVEPVRSWTRRDGRTRVELDFAPRGSVFVRFRPGNPASLPVKLAQPAVVRSIPMSEGWKVRFSAGMGAPGEVDFPVLASWTERPEKGIRYYSGIAVYRRDVNIPADLLKPGGRVILDLGEVKNLARITVNGIAFPEVWKPPFACDIASAVRPGTNHVTVEVANLWANRLVGDEQEPSDIDWGPEQSGGLRPLASYPEWLVKGTPRPSSERRTFTTYNYIRKDQPLLRSGLLGPVSLAFEALPPAR